MRSYNPTGLYTELKIKTDPIYRIHISDYNSVARRPSRNSHFICDTMIDWIEATSGFLDISVRDITKQVAIPSTDPQFKWFYTPRGRLVQLTVINGELNIIISDDGEITNHVVIVEFNNQPIDLDARGLTIAGWCEKSVKGLKNFVGESTKRQLIPRLIKTETATSKSPLRFMIVIRHCNYEGLFEFVWSQGQLSISHAHTHRLRSVLYFLTSVGYCWISHKGNYLTVQSPSGNSKKFPIKLTDFCYEQCTANEYGLLYQRKNFYISWSRDISFVRLDDMQSYVLSERHLMYCTDDQINITDIIDGSYYSVKTSDKPIEPIGFDSEYQVVIARTETGIALRRLRSEMPVYHLTPILEKEIVSGEENIIPQRHEEVVLKLYKNIDTSRGTLNRPSWNNPNFIDSMLRLAINIDNYVYQWIPELHLLIVRFKYVNYYVVRVYQITADS